MDANKGLHRVHMIIFCFYALLALLAVGSGVFFGAAEDYAVIPWSIGCLFLVSLAALHWVAAKGAREGKQWGRTTSRVIAVFLLFGVPVGTLIAIYIFFQTGNKWRYGDSVA